MAKTPSRRPPSRGQSLRGTRVVGQTEVANDEAPEVMKAAEDVLALNAPRPLLSSQCIICRSQSADAQGFSGLEDEVDYRGAWTFQPGVF